MVEFLLLLVYYPKTEIDLVCLFKVGLHAHDLREGFFGMLERAIAVVQDTDSVPEFWLLLTLSVTRHERGWIGFMSYFRVTKVVESLLVSSVCFLQVIQHEIAVSYIASVIVLGWWQI